MTRPGATFPCDVGPILEVAEVAALTEALLREAGPSTKGDIFRVVNWAIGVRTEAAVLQLILDGRLGVRLEDADLVFVAKRPSNESYFEPEASE